MKSYHKLIGGAVLLGILLPVAALAQGLPGGASTLNETHGDWTVVCSAAEGTPRCVMSQTQVGGESRQRVLTVELRATEADAVGGVLVLPFGLNLDHGVSLAIDDAAPSGSLRFSTCLPVGCLVPLDFDANAVAAMRAGNAIAVRAAASETGQEVGLSISLLGFTSAVTRVAELSGQ